LSLSRTCLIAGTVGPNNILAEHFGLSFRSEFFNIFNHPDFGSPNNSVTDLLALRFSASEFKRS